MIKINNIIKPRRYKKKISNIIHQDQAIKIYIIETINHYNLIKRMKVVVHVFVGVAVEKIQHKLENL